MNWWWVRLSHASIVVSHGLLMELAVEGTVKRPWIGEAAMTNQHTHTYIQFDVINNQYEIATPYHAVM
jgi:hypothetical protein